jgi:hypothetical protein
MVRVEARAVEARERCDAAEAARDAALEQKQIAEAVVDATRASLINKLCERTDAMLKRLDKFERARAREYLDSLPDPEDPYQGGDQSLVGPARFHNPADPAGIDDQIPAPKDPTGMSLQKKDQTLPQYSPR